MARKKGNKNHNKSSAKQKQATQNQTGIKGGGFGDVVQGSHSGKKKK
jgi:hypothetical protein